MQVKKMRRWVYVLRLVGSSVGGHYAPNYYVGQTNDIPSRLQKHWTGQGSKWTQLYAPVSVVECMEVPHGDATGFEIAKFAEYALRHSWQRVRGGSFTRVDSGPPPWWDPTGLRRKNRRLKDGETGREGRRRSDGESNSAGGENGMARGTHQKGEADGECGGA